MTERDFWIFMKNALKEGRAACISSSIECDELQQSGAVRFLNKHAILPKNYDKVPVKEIREMGRLLFNKMTSISTKEVIVILLAHQVSQEALHILQIYNEQPDEELRIFAQLALDECKMWNE